MKLLFTMIMVLCGLSLFSQIRLDSIVVMHDDQDISSDYFIYDDENLMVYGRSINSDTFEFTFEYNDMGDYKRWLVGEDGDFTTLDFFYNTNNLLDSFTVSEDGETFALYDYEFENDELESITVIDLIGANSGPETRVDFAFENGLIKTRVEYDISDGNDDLNFKDLFEYNNNSKLIKKTRNGYGIEIDSLSYDAEGSIIDYHQLYVEEGFPTEITKIEVYTSDPLISFDNILNPTSFLDCVYNFSGQIFTEKHYAIKNGNKVDMSMGDFYYGTGVAQWYYSAFVGTNERVVTTPISVYPNPTVDRIRIKSEETMTKFYIYDFGGALISEGTPGNDNAIDVYQLSTGSYTVICSNKDDKHYFAQFVKQ